MSQTKKASIVEAASNVLVGFVTTMMFSPAIYWLAGVEIKVSKQFGVTAMFTVVSLVRSYALRRWFNKNERKVNEAAKTI